MKKILLGLLILLNLQGSAQKKKEGFVLDGNIVGLKNGASIYLVTVIDNIVDTIAKSKSIDSKFTIKGFIEGESNYYFLKTDSVIKKDFSNALWLVNNRITLSGRLDDFNFLELTGSEPHLEYNKVRKISKENKKDNNKKLQLCEEFITQHPNSLYISDLIIKMMGPLGPKGLVEGYGNLTSRAKNSYWGLELGKLVKQIKIADSFRINGKIPDFKFTTIDGKKISLLEIIRKSKYTLIDFWASWCGPCRMAIPKLSKVYETFHDKGFNIIGLSTDKKETAWRKAVKEDNTPWVHGLDNIENAGKNIFALTAIPGYILVDQHGAIIQTDIFSGSDSRKKIKQAEDKSLSIDLYEIIEQLLKEEKSK